MQREKHQHILGSPHAMSEEDEKPTFDPLDASEGDRGHELAE